MAPSDSPKPSFVSSLLQTVSDHFKPHRAEALQRIRINAFCFVLVFIFSNLLPLPTAQSSIRMVMSSSKPERWETDWLYRWFCITEVTLTSIFGFNVLEGVYAIKYPRAPVPPTPGKAKAKSLFPTAPTPQRSFKILSPQSSPQLQKAFSISQSASFSGSPQKYPVSPLSTPSRVINYPSVAASSTTTNASSTSTMLFHSTPSPAVTAYRSKHSNSVGRALDESFLGRIPPSEDDDEN